jgi:hypothetical protein
MTQTLLPIADTGTPSFLPTPTFSNINEPLATPLATVDSTFVYGAVGATNVFTVRMGLAPSTPVGSQLTLVLRLATVNNAGVLTEETGVDPSYRFSLTNSGFGGIFFDQPTTTMISSATFADYTFTATVDQLLLTGISESNPLFFQFVSVGSSGGKRSRHRAMAVSRMYVIVPPGAPAATPPQMKYWNGTAWVLKPLKRWDGAAWVNDKVLKYWNGTAWVVAP